MRNFLHLRDRSFNLGVECFFPWTKNKIICIHVHKKSAIFFILPKFLVENCSISLFIFLHLTDESIIFFIKFGNRNLKNKNKTTTFAPPPSRWKVIPSCLVGKVYRNLSSYIIAISKYNSPHDEYYWSSGTRPVKYYSDR